MTLAEDTWRIGTNETTGLLMGIGTVYDVVYYRFGLGPIITNDLQYGSIPGAYPARDTQGPRTVALNVEVYAGGGNTMAVNAGLLIDAWTNGDQNVRLYWRLVGQAGSRYLVGRPRLTGDLTWDKDSDAGVQRVELDFFAPKPGIFLTSGDAPTNF